MSQNVWIVGAARTAQGSFQGALASLPAPKLGAVAIQGALKRAGVKPDQVSEVIMGNVLTAGEGQAPARQALIFSGIPKTVPAMMINKVCGSGMKSCCWALRASDRAIAKSWWPAGWRACPTHRTCSCKRAADLGWAINNRSIR